MERRGCRQRRRQWLERGTKIAVFDLAASEPRAKPTSASEDIEMIFRTSSRRERRTTVSAEATDEIRADDILVEYPSIRRSLPAPRARRAPRGARRSSRRSCLAVTAIATPFRRRRTRRSAAPRGSSRPSIGASGGLVLAAAIAKYEGAPIHRRGDTFRRAARRKIVEQHARCSHRRDGPHRQRRQPSPRAPLTYETSAMSCARRRGDKAGIRGRCAEKSASSSRPGHLLGLQQVQEDERRRRDAPAADSRSSTKPFEGQIDLPSPTP